MTAYYNWMHLGPVLIQSAASPRIQQWQAEIQRKQIEIKDMLSQDANSFIQNFSRFMVKAQQPREDQNCEMHRYFSKRFAQLDSEYDSEDPALSLYEDFIDPKAKKF